MGFSKKASKGSGGSSKDYTEFNEHVHEQIMEVVSEDFDPIIGIISGIIEAGVQPVETTVEPYKGTEAQEYHLENTEGAFVDEEEGEIHIPRKPQDSVVFYVDFPEILIDYGKYMDNVDDDQEPLPYRISLTGDWWNKAVNKMFAKTVGLKCLPNEGKTPSGWGYHHKSTIHKLANATGCVRGQVDQDFDIGEILGGAAMFSLESELDEKGGKTYHNVKVKDPTKIPKVMSVPEHDIEPFGVMLDVEPEGDEIKYIATKNSLINSLELAVNYKGSVMEKCIKAYQKANASETTSKKEEAEEGEKPTKKVAPKRVSSKTAPKKAPAKKVVPEDDDGEDEDDPFNT